MFKKPLGLLGIFLIIVGIGYFVGAGVAYSKVQGGYGSLQAFSQAQNVELSYNEDGQLVDRGTVEGAQAIMSLLKDDWDFPVVNGDIEPNDPLVNTASEYMYQMATISFHTLNSTQVVTLTADRHRPRDRVGAAGMPTVPTTAWSGLPGSTSSDRSHLRSTGQRPLLDGLRPRRSAEDRLVTWPGAALLTLWSPNSVSVRQRTAHCSSLSVSPHCWPASAWSARSWVAPSSGTPRRR